MKLNSQDLEKLSHLTLEHYNQRAEDFWRDVAAKRPENWRAYASLGGLARLRGQTPEAIDVIRKLRDAGVLGDEFVLHLGTNGTLDGGQFDEIMQMLTGVKRVVVVNARVDRTWEQQVNETIAAGVARYPNAVLFDWHAAGSEHPEFFVEDGVHLTGDGARYYALLISSKL